ncbi:hypothetical protein LEMLEM_LOCUS6532 [Lemmus lemmus]
MESRSRKKATGLGKPELRGEGEMKMGVCGGLRIGRWNLEG